MCHEVYIQTGKLPSEICNRLGGRVEWKGKRKRRKQSLYDGAKSLKWRGMHIGEYSCMSICRGYSLFLDSRPLRPLYRGHIHVDRFVY